MLKIFGEKMSSEFEVEVEKLKTAIWDAKLEVGGEFGLSLEPAFEGQELIVGRAVVEKANAMSNDVAYALDEQRVSARSISIERIK